MRSFSFALLLVLAACDSRSYVIGRFSDERCEQSSELFCSGFERPDLAEWGEVAIEADAAVAQTDERAYEGKGALYAHSFGAESSAVVVHDFAPVTEGTLYLHARLFIPSDQPTETINLFFLGDFPTPDPFVGIDLNLEDGAPSIYSPQSNPDRVTSTSLTVPRDAWFCFRAEVTVSEDAGAVRLYVDDALALEHLAIDTLPEAGIHVLRAGVDWSSGQAAPFELYIDELVLDVEPVSCE